jgi:hypothetical protein
MIGTRVATPAEGRMIANTVAAQLRDVMERRTGKIPTWETYRDDGTTIYMPVYPIRYPARFAL